MTAPRTQPSDSWLEVPIDAGQVAARVTALADAYLSEFVSRFPDQAEIRGFAPRRHDGLTDNSLEALAAWRALEDQWYDVLTSINGEILRGRPEWVTFGFLKELIEASRGLRICRYELWPVNHLSGWQAMFAQLAQMQPVGSDAAREEALARWGLLPRYLDTEALNLRAGIDQGYSTPTAIVRLVITQLDDLLAAPVERWPFYSPAERDTSPVFRSRWLALLSQRLRPTVRRYRDYLQTEYLPVARDSISIAAHPHGRSCYAASLRAYTTLDRSPEETFELGCRVVERNRLEALGIGRARLGSGDLAGLVQRLTDDPANHFKSRDELLAFVRDAVARGHQTASAWFRQLPRAEVAVEPYPEFLESSIATDSYRPAAEDGSRPAVYRIVLHRPEDKTRSNSEISAFHEVYPGHHLQLELAREREVSHAIMRLVGNAAFSEGWARYAEVLAEEMGLYSSDVARVSRRLWPGRGMVVDPGIHLFGWTRKRALEFILESGRYHRQQADALIDRIAIWPAQLTAYDPGALELLALREQARGPLGHSFDIREFHDVVLRNGSITLPMLRVEVNAWLQSKRR